MTEFNNHLPDFFDVDSSIADNHRDLLLNAYNNPENTGNFILVDTKNLRVVINTIKQELSYCPFEIVPETGNIKYAQTLHGYRDAQKYIFKIDARNSFNQEISNNFNWPVFSLNFPYKIPTYCFYFILNQKDLSLFAELFSNWLSKIDLPFSD
ncbi:MAG: hypothetical protein WCT51_04600 [Candidatus Shapirobacteria bacterium]|jgi:hypothetical protein